MMKFKTPDLKERLETVLDTFSGADGGVVYAQFLGMLTELDRKAAEGDAASQELVKVVIRMGRLIKAAQPAPIANRRLDRV